ncbi:hypothetical protein ACFQVA_17875 [Actinomadura keratinilytica]
METPLRDTERTPDAEPPAPEEQEPRPDPARRKRRGPGPFLLLVLPTLTVVLAGAVFLVATDRLSGLLGGDDGDQAPAPQAVTDRVDPSLLPWLRKAADRCDTLRPSVLAAQIDLRSGWSNDGAALSGPSGLAGFTPPSGASGARTPTATAPRRRRTPPTPSWPSAAGTAPSPNA